MNVIERETYEHLNLDDKVNVLFDYVKYLSKKAEETNEKLDRKAKVDTTMSAVMGFVGGIVAVIGKFLFFK